jgi:hypothetical protein
LRLILYILDFVTGNSIKGVDYPCFGNTSGGTGGWFPCIMHGTEVFLEFGSNVS